MYRLGRQQRKLDALFGCLYLVPKEGDVTYEQQCDVILKPKHLQLQVLSTILDSTRPLS